MSGTALIVDLSTSSFICLNVDFFNKPFSAPLTEANRLEEHGDCGELEEAFGAFCQQAGHSAVKQRPQSGPPAAGKDR